MRWDSQVRGRDVTREIGEDLMRVVPSKASKSEARTKSMTEL